MTVVDICFCVLCGIFAFLGWRKGAIKVILGPLVWFACLYLAWGYFFRTGKWGLSLVIASICPIVLIVLFNYIIKIFCRPYTYDTGSSDKPKHSKVNSFIGMIAAVIWNGGMMAVMIIMFGLAPLSISGVATHWQDSVRASWVFQTFSSPLLEKVPVLCFLSYQDTLTTDEIANNNKTLFNSSEFKALMDDDRLKSFYADEEIQAMIKEKNVAGLMADKRVQDIMADPEMLSKLWAFADKASKPQPKSYE